MNARLAPHDEAANESGLAPALRCSSEPFAVAVTERPRVCGKFIHVGGEKFWIRGVTYGGFAPGPGGDDYPRQDVLEQDFAQMRAYAVNTVRCYTLPPRRLLDAALRHGLKVIAGLAWEQHVAFLDEGRARDIEQRVRADVRGCGAHPALLCIAIGNEIPASIVRWHGARRIERFLHRLCLAVKAVDPAVLVTYVNFPTTEYLRLPFLDFLSFNVYLESPEQLRAYLARLQNLAGEKPLLMAEIGLDSRSNGLDTQAQCLDWQLHTAFAEGCAGACVYAWTDEWHRGGHAIEDWDFGLTTRERQPKPALAVVASTFRHLPFPTTIEWPRISVVVCSYNGARTIRDTFEGLRRLAYPNFEVIVIDDGSTDATALIAGEYPVRLIRTDNRGLSAARNTGWQAADGEIVAYIDDDAWPDPHWLHYLAHRFMCGDWVGVGGPNIAPPGDGPVADCVANAPGGPVHVLLDDIEAEHIPGCNMAFRRSALEAVGGFDVRFRSAGDDVDLCWQLQDRGGRIGFHAGAMDWHHRRNSLSMYWRQQVGYGKAEALLEAKWPQRYNTMGHLAWSGRVYGRGFTLPIPSGRARIYGGVWGSAGYQSLYEARPLTLLALPLMPEWALLIATLALLCSLGWSWPPLWWLTVALVPALAAPLLQAALAAHRASYPAPAVSRGRAARRWVLTFVLHLMQPLARLCGRLQHGLTPWRRVMPAVPRAWPWSRHRLWSESWRAADAWIEHLEQAAMQRGALLRRGGTTDPWDLELRCGSFASLRLHVCVEEHGAGRQLVRTAVYPRLHPLAGLLAAAAVTLATLATADGAWVAAVALGFAALTVGWRTWLDCSAACGVWQASLPALPPATDLAAVGSGARS